MAFVDLQRDACIPQGRSDFVNETNVVFYVVGEDDHVVKVHETRLPLEPREDNVKCSLKSRGRVGETKWHTYALERS